MLLIIDNYDSFTYNLAQYFLALGVPVTVKLNDAVSVDDIATLNPAAIVISPGPGRPEEAGISLAAIARFHQDIPFLGVCLGHQALAIHAGAKVMLADQLMHGKSCKITHHQQGLFANLDNPLQVGRYHSWVVDQNSLPPTWQVSAHSEDNAVMAMAHRTLPLYGVQFHPESILTESGMALLNNFLIDARIKT